MIECTIFFKLNPLWICWFWKHVGESPGRQGCVLGCAGETLNHITAPVLNTNVEEVWLPIRAVWGLFGRKSDIQLQSAQAQSVQFPISFMGDE